MDEDVLGTKFASISKTATEMCNTMLRGTQIRIAVELERSWAGDIRRVLIARRLILEMAKGEPELGQRLYLMGFIKDKEDIQLHLNLDRDPYRQYYFQVGLTSRVIADPLSTDGIWPEERDWYQAYTPPGA